MPPNLVLILNKEWCIEYDYIRGECLRVKSYLK